MKKLLTITAAWLCCYSGVAQDTNDKPTFWEKLKTPQQKSNTETVSERTNLPIDPATNKVTYTEILEAPKLSKKELYDKANKWLLTKNSPSNPYTITYENEKEGNLVGKGSFTLPAENRKYVVQFIIKVFTKPGKLKYEFTDLMVQYRTAGGSSGAGFGYWSSSSHKEAETLEYSIETFYPSRLTSRKPAIKWYEEIRARSFGAVNREMESIAASLKQSTSIKEDW